MTEVTGESKATVASKKTLGDFMRLFSKWQKRRETAAHSADGLLCRWTKHNDISTDSNICLAGGV
jgi:hypothetical protein